MALGLARVRNWGREAQEGALALALARGRLTYQVRSAGRGRWEARSLWDDRVRATGVSHQDVIRATIEAVWH